MYFIRMAQALLAVTGLALRSVMRKFPSRSTVGQAKQRPEAWPCAQPAPMSRNGRPGMRLPSGVKAPLMRACCGSGQPLNLAKIAGLVSLTGVAQAFPDQTG